MLIELPLLKFPHFPSCRSLICEINAQACERSKSAQTAYPKLWLRNSHDGVGVVLDFGHTDLWILLLGPAHVVANQGPKQFNGFPLRSYSQMADLESIGVREYHLETPKVS